MHVYSITIKDHFMKHRLNDKHEKVTSIPLVKGLIIILWGILALVLFQSAHIFLIRSFGILNLLVAMLTLWFILQQPYLKITGQWLKLEAGIELAAGIVFTFLVHSTDDFIYYISIGIFFIIILQFIYGYALLNTGVYNVANLVMRFITLLSGVVIGVTLFSGMVGFSQAFLVVGVFSIIYGIINVRYGLTLKSDVLGTIN